MDVARAVAKKDTTDPCGVGGVSRRDAEQNATVDDRPAKSLGHLGGHERAWIADAARHGEDCNSLGARPSCFDSALQKSAQRIETPDFWSRRNALNARRCPRQAKVRP
jgi:hypothetical protein